MEKIEHNNLECKIESAYFFNDKSEDVYKRNIMHYSHIVAYESILTLTTEIFYGYIIQCMIYKHFKISLRSCHTYSDKIWNKSESIYRSYRIFITNRQLIKHWYIYIYIYQWYIYDIYIYIIHDIYISYIQYMIDIYIYIYE